MATRSILRELAMAFGRHTRLVASFESVGGVDAVQRLMACEPFDLAVLASDAIDRLIDSGRRLADSRMDFARSAVALAVPAGAPRPTIRSEAEMRRAVESARRIGYSTGPSGSQPLQLFEHWGIAGHLRDRLVRSPPGVPVGMLLARREVDIGFQQLSELLEVEGIDVVGTRLECDASPAANQKRTRTGTRQRRTPMLRCIVGAAAIR